MNIGADGHDANGFDEADLATLLANSSELIAVLDRRGTITWTAPSATTLLGHGHSWQAGATLIGVVDAADADALQTALEAVRDDDAVRVIEIGITAGDGSPRRIQLRASRAADLVGSDIVVNGRDVTQLREVEDRLRDERQRDPLTDLPTRGLFIDYVNHALARSQRRDWSTVVIAVDLDGFSTINEELGSAVGDGLLVAVAERIQQSLRAYDVTARSVAMTSRVAGDEFLVLCEDVPDVDAATRVARRILDAVAAPLTIGGHPLPVTACAGVGVAAHRDDADALVARAEAALRHAKRGGSDTVKSTAPAEDQVERYDTVADLRRALGHTEFRLVYQPKVSLATDRIVGFEALLRWEHPTRGLVTPAEFIPVAERSRLIIPMGAWVLGEACRQAAEWHERNLDGIVRRVQLNVSPLQFRAGLIEIVREATAASGVDPTAIGVEVTEGTVMGNVTTAIDILGQLRDLGVTVSIDDFGTGYSSLSYLRRLPIDEVKIDKTFVDGLGIDPEDTAIAAAIVSLAQTLHYDVVAEGVETLDQLERLRDLGCDFAQGYFLARPAPPRDIDALLAEEAAGRRLGRTGQAPPMARTIEIVLVCDDADDVRQLARMAMTAAGFTVEEASTGRDSLAQARRVRPDCILLDLDFPDMNGIEICSALRADPLTANTTIVMLTAHADAANKAEAFSIGADDYIVKPFAPRDLVNRLTAAIRRRTQSR